MAESGNDSDTGLDSELGDGNDFVLGEGRGSIPDATKFIDPASASSGDGSGAGKSSGKRGRPKGSTNKKSAPKSQKIDLGAFAGILFGAHSMLAAISKVPELELDEKEAEKLAKASHSVMRHYVALDVTEKAADWMNLFMACGAIYGPRIVAAKMRKKNNQAPRQPQQETRAPSAGGNVVQMPIASPIGSATGDFGGSGGGPGIG